MKSKAIIIFLLFSSHLFCQEDNVNDKKFKLFLPKNFEINTVVNGKFDDDLLDDYLLILNKITENDNSLLSNRDSLTKRKVIILKGLAGNKYEKIYEDDNIVPPREYAGKSDYSYDKLSIKKNIFIFSSPKSEFGQDYFRLMTYKLKFDGRDFKLIEYNEVYSASPEEDEILINFTCNEITGSGTNPFDIYKWRWQNADNLKINSSNVKKINNIAYNLSQSKNYYDAIFLLENLISQNPNRVVAYLNIADCYWETNQKSKAVDNYNKYILLMRSQKKDLKKIPKYVYERVK